MSKSMPEIFNTLSEMGALTKASFIKASVANGHDRISAQEFWAEETDNKMVRESHNDIIISLFVGGPVSENKLYHEVVELGKTGPAQWIGYWNRVRVGFNKVWKKAGGEVVENPATEAQKKLVRELAIRNKGK